VGDKDVSGLSRSLRRLPSRREVVRGVVGIGIGLGTLRLAESAEAKKKRKKRKKRKQPQDQVPQELPPPPPPPPPPPVCTPLGGSCIPGQGLCCGEVGCVEIPVTVPIEMLAPAAPTFTCCKNAGATCGTTGECCAGLRLSCVAGVCQRTAPG
jgi:hypothetical protein